MGTMLERGALAAGWMCALVAVCGLAACGGDGDGPAPAPTAQEACDALKGSAVPASAIGKPTSGALVQSATMVAAAASGNTNGEYCAVTGVIFPAAAGAPSTEFQVNLPTSWNQKALQEGGGGYDGTLQTATGPIVAQANGVKNPIAQVHDVALALIDKRYGAKPTRFYFIGGSQGGHEALDAAARYSADYDGVIANYPAYNLSFLQQASWYVGKALYENAGAGWINDNKRSLLVNAVYAACDDLDGTADGIIGNISACNTTFNIDTVKATLRCAGGVDTGDSCLSDAQIAAVDKISSPFDLGFPMAGQQVFARWPLLEGADFKFFGTTTAFGFGPVPTLAATPPVDALLYTIGVAHVRYFVTQNPTFDALTYDPATYQSRLQAVADITDVTSQSLDAFRAKGGKVILTHGTADTLISPHNSEDYYRRQVAQFGQGTVDGFIRFYMIPGWDHGFGRFNTGYDGLKLLEDWVEKGQAPDTPVAMDNNTADPAAARTRPMCRWPAWPKFTGAAGTENNASSYTCATS